MPSTGTHRYTNPIVPVTKGTVSVSGTLTLPTTGTTTFKLMKEIYNSQGIYTIFTYASLVGGGLANIEIDDTNIRTIGLMYKANSMKFVGNSIVIVVEAM
jgi:hypothetical protein